MRKKLALEKKNCLGNKLFMSIEQQAGRNKQIVIGNHKNFSLNLVNSSFHANQLSNTGNKINRQCGADCRWMRGRQLTEWRSLRGEKTKYMSRHSWSNKRSERVWQSDKLVGYGHFWGLLDSHTLCWYFNDDKKKSSAAKSKRQDH